MLAPKAIWFPFWYELDQSVEIGEIADFDFFLDPPEYVKHDGLPVFYHGDWQEKCKHLYVRQKRRILKIEHARIGLIRKIDTKGLDYTFLLCDGTVLEVNAEETPGVIHGLRIPIADWRIFVDIELA